MSCRVFSVRVVAGFHYVTLAAHRSAVRSCFFRPDSLSVRVGTLRAQQTLWEKNCINTVCSKKMLVLPIDVLILHSGTD